MKFFCISILFFITFNCLAETHGSEYFHVPEKRAVINIMPAEKSIAIGDLAHVAKFCEPSIPRHCFNLQKLVFAVPKKFDTLKTWTHEGHTYSVIQKLSTRGEYPAWVIQKTSGDRWWYLWSAHRGLMMFGEGSKSNASGTYFLDGLCGFGADLKCTNQSK
jgi:hypothetical protein